jgi:hypothetical protein
MVLSNFIAVRTLLGDTRGARGGGVKPRATLALGPPPCDTSQSSRFYNRRGLPVPRFEVRHWAASAPRVAGLSQRVNYLALAEETAAPPLHSIRPNTCTPLRCPGSQGRSG